MFNAFGVRAALAVVVAAAFAMGTATPVAAREAASVLPAGIVPAPVSTMAEPGSGSVPDGSFAPEPRTTSAVRASGGHEPPPADLDGLDLESLPVVQRDEFRTVYQLTGSQRVAVLSGTPANVRVGGEWVAIEDTLVRASDGWAGTAHPLSPEFSATSGGDVLTVSTGSVTLSQRLLGVDEVRGVASQRRDGTLGGLRYRDVLGDVDLTYDLTPSLVKEALVLAGGSEG
ncbi:MAG: hypothetical protein R2717_01585 [Schumannella sp.]